jgi:hypothetical protein
MLYSMYVWKSTGWSFKGRDSCLNIWSVITVPHFEVVKKITLLELDLTVCLLVRSFSSTPRVSFLKSVFIKFVWCVTFFNKFLHV